MFDSIIKHLSSMERSTPSAVAVETSRRIANIGTAGIGTVDMACVPTLPDHFKLIGLLNRQRYFLIYMSIAALQESWNTFYTVPTA